MNSTSRGVNNKYSTAQIGTPKITKSLLVGVYNEFSDCFVSVYNPNETYSKLFVYNTSKDPIDIGKTFPPGYNEFIYIPNG